jgi:serine/threonine protein kinase
MDSENIFVAMEYLRHGDLSNYATTELLETEIIEITDNILRGLKAMHEEGFTHRDIKPQV